MRRLYKYLFYFFLLIGCQAVAQSFTTQVSAKSIGKKDLIQVDYIAENLELSNFQLPAFKGWNIQSGPNFSSSQEQIGNQVKQKIIYSFILQPLRVGKLSVPSATITIDRHNIRQSNTVTINVKDVDHVAGRNVTMPQVPSLFDDPPAPQDDLSVEQVLKNGENPLDKIKDNILVRLDVNKTSAFVGEPIIATYKLCTRLKSQSRVLKQPAFSGCTVVELTTENPTPKKEVINGKQYNVYVIRKVQLYPLQEGLLVLPQASVENKVSFYKGGNVNFRDLYYDRSGSQVEETQVTLANKSATVDIKSLPTPTPASFNGAIGNFRIATLPADDKPVTTKNSAGFTVIIEGVGNLEQAKAPAISWPSGIEAFEAAEKDESDKSSVPVIVRKTFTYPFVVNKPGAYTIPSVNFTFFNPATSSYVTVASKPLSFNVAKGKNAVFSVINNSNDSGFQTRLYIMLAGGLVLIGAGLLLFNKKSKAVPAIVSPPKAAAPVNIVHTEAIKPVTDQYIHNISNLNPIENRNFYKQLQRELLGYLQTRHGIGDEGIDKLALSRPQDAECLVRLKALLKDCSLGMYTPMFNTEEEMKHRLLAIEILTKLEKSSI